MKKLFIIAGVVITFAFGDVSATIINVPADYDTIQVAINASIDGDTVLVAEGHYYERINFYGKGILLTSEFMLDSDTLHIQNTIINADTSVLGIADTGSVVCFVSGEDSTSIIQGFTIQKGIGTIFSSNYRHGGAIYCDGSSPAIVKNIIRENYLYGGYGSGIYCGDSYSVIIDNTISDNHISGGSGSGIGCVRGSPVIVNNLFFENISPNSGGGIFCSNSDCLISHNTFTDNFAAGGGGISCSSCNPMITFNLFYDNRAINGGGIRCRVASPTIGNNAFFSNRASTDGGGIKCQVNSYPLILNNILFADSVYGGGVNEIGIDDDSDPIVRYCNIQGGWEGEGNIDVDPLFRNPENEDFHLMAIECGDPYDSPCIDMGHPDLLDSLLDCGWGLGELRSDMGAYGGGDSVEVSIDELLDLLPKRFILSQNYPNPFNASTTITFSLPKQQLVTLKIYDLLGREVQTLVDAQRQAGMYTVRFDASELSSGIYFYHLQAGDNSVSKKMVLLK